MKIERAPGDFAAWDALLMLIQRSFAYMEGRIDPPSSARDLTASGLAARAKLDVLLIARQHQTAPRACAFLTPRQDALYISKLAVDPSCQGQGLGRQMIQSAVAIAQQLKLARLQLQTRVELVENHAAFASMGFLETGQSAHPGFDRPTSITMERPVPPLAP